MKKTSENHVLTKDYLDKKLKVFVTKDYLDKKLKVFVTKDYLDKKLKDFVTNDSLEEKLGNLKKDLSREMLNWKVEIVGEIKAMREEFDTHQYSHLRINETLEDHEKRLTSLGSPAV